VPWALLVLGGELPVKTPYGNDTLKLASGTQADKVVKLPNAGVPRLRGAGRGDLYLHLRVAVPQKLSAGQTELVRRLLDDEVASGAVTEPSEGFLSKVFGGENGKKKKNR
jgi:molecular chaperone DnaJ